VEDVLHRWLRLASAVWAPGETGAESQVTWPERNGLVGTATPMRTSPGTVFLHLRQNTFSADNLSEAGKIYCGTAPPQWAGAS
jgi:hypothetical protein